MRARRRHMLEVAIIAIALVATGVGRGASPSREGGIVRITVPAGDLDYVDPALAYSAPSWALLDTTCARLMTYPDKPPPQGLRLVPEVATAPPKIARNGKTYTFTLRKGFRFSDGTPVRASAFARAINRALALGDRTAAVQFVSDIAGAAEVQAGKATAATGVIARGDTLVVEFTRPVRDFAAKTTMPFFCAVPPTLPSDPEGVGAYPAAGPYVITDYRPGERVTLRRNRFYGGRRPRHVDGFDVDLRASSEDEIVDQVEHNVVDWAPLRTVAYFTPGRDLAAKYGVNKSRFFVKPGFTLRYIVFNVARPLFRDARLRRAVSFALDRRALARAVSPSPLADRLTDQYLPLSMPGFEDAKIYPLDHPDLVRARQLAQGSGRKATVYVSEDLPPLTVAQLVKQQLAKFGLDVEVKAFPRAAYFNKITTPGEPWDLTVQIWSPDFADPFSYLNQLFDPGLAGGADLGRFDSHAFSRLLRKAARLQGQERYRTYGDLDVRLAREAAPIAAISFLNAATFVSDRVGCIVLRPTLDLTGACLK